MEQQRKRKLSDDAGAAHKVAKFEPAQPAAPAAAHNAQAVASSSNPGSEEFIATLAAQLEKIASVGDLFFQKLALGHEQQGEQTGDHVRGPEFFEDLQQSRRNLYELVEKMLNRAHLLSTAPNGVQAYEAAMTRARRDLSLQGKVVADTNKLLDSTFRSIFAP